MRFQGKNVVLGVTGGIAAYKSCEVVSRLVKEGAQVDVIMTENACRFVAPLSFQTLSRRPVVTDTFATPEHWEVEHIALAKKADLFLIAPATANIIAKMACGLADDMLSTTVLAAKAPILVAPAMNTGMLENAATRQNFQTLSARGVHFVGPEGGLLACGDVGAGRMSEPSDIVEACASLLLTERDLEGLRILITAGPTREAIDPVRFLSNRSTGRMGYALAEQALKRGARVTLVSGPVALAVPAGAKLVDILSTHDLYQAMKEFADKQDIIIQAAAPADFTPENTAKEKIKKSGRENLTLSMKATEDVALALGKQKRDGQILVGFAAETQEVLDSARQKLQKKNLDMIVANDVSKPGAGFEGDTNIVTLITATKEESLPLMSKKDVADHILSQALALYKKGGA